MFVGMFCLDGYDGRVRKAGRSEGMRRRVVVVVVVYGPLKGGAWLCLEWSWEVSVRKDALRTT